MYIPEDMKKENLFQDVAIPSNKSFFARLGQVSPDSLKYTGDEVVPEQLRKTDSLNDYMEYAEQMAKAESQK